MPVADRRARVAPCDQGEDRPRLEVVLRRPGPHEPRPLGTRCPRALSAQSARQAAHVGCGALGAVRGALGSVRGAPGSVERRGDGVGELEAGDGRQVGGGEDLQPCGRIVSVDRHQEVVACCDRLPREVRVEVA